MKLNCKILLILFVLATGIWSCGQKTENKKKDIEVKESCSLKDFDWLEGNWLNITEEFEFYENWQKSTDTQFVGESYMMMDGDTVFSEYIILEEKNDNVNYIVSVSDQNDGEGVAFKLISVEENTFTFSNPEHDYPQTIVYRYVAPDSLYAYIEGKLDGIVHREDFVMVRGK
jgi:hypothetical protein